MLGLNKQIAIVLVPREPTRLLNLFVHRLIVIHAYIGSDKIAVALYADGAPTEGKEWTLALRFTPSASEWHGYWSNPGDAGQGMRLSLNLPPDWEVGEARYPVPKRLLIRRGVRVARLRVKSFQ